MPSIALRAKFILPINQPPIEGGVVEIEEERIVAVHSRASTNGTVIDLGDVALLPGFVNMHTHLEFSDCETPLGSPGTKLVDWLRMVISERGRIKRQPDLAISSGLSESLEFGVTTIGEIATADQDAYKFPQPQPDVLRFQESIGFSRARADSAFIALSEQLSENSFGLSPHAPYTVGLDLFEKILEHSKTNSMPIAMHIAESLEELQLLSTSTGPFQELLEERGMWDDSAIKKNSRPLDYLERLATVPKSLVVHGNYLEQDELKFMGENRKTMSLVYCPRTHHYFRHKEYPLAQAIEAGVRVVLGTDSKASNPSLNLLDEMRWVHHCHLEIPPELTLKMGTSLAAESLGKEKEVGSLSEGKIANMVAIPLDSKAVNQISESNVSEVILESTALPSRVWLRGKEVTI